jgi:hypothetical protein
MERVTTTRGFVLEVGTKVYVRDIAGTPAKLCEILALDENGFTTVRYDRPSFLTYDRVVGVVPAAGASFAHGCCAYCGHAPASPWRRRDASGAIVEGCVSPAHGVEDLSSEDKAWHYRDQSADARAHCMLPAVITAI